MGLDFRHPSNAKLLSWLETGEPSKVQAHVEQCERCADRLVLLDGEEQRASGNEPRRRRDRVAEMLSALYAAPEDLNDRVVRSVEVRSQGEREFALFAGLLAVGLDTARLMTAAAAGDTATADTSEMGSRRDRTNNDDNDENGDSLQ